MVARGGACNGSQIMGGVSNTWAALRTHVDITGDGIVSGELLVKVRSVARRRNNDSRHLFESAKRCEETNK
jgi:hypothetical protein